MSDAPPDPDFHDDEGRPRWVYVSGIIAIVLILAFVVLHITGHAPRGHLP